MISKIETSLTAIELFRMIENETMSFILESSLYNEKYGRYSIISSSPFETVKFSEDPLCFDKFEKIMNNYSGKKYGGSLPFYAGAVGYISYDAGRCIEKLPQAALKDLDIPDLYFGLYDWAFVVDHKDNSVYITSADIDKEKEESITDFRKKQISLYEKSIKTGMTPEEIATLEITVAENKNTPGDEKIKLSEKETVSLRSNFTKQGYIDTIKTVKEYIKSGDIYQANLTQRFKGRTSRTASDIYMNLREVSPTIFGGLLNFSDVNVISNSPERFISIRDRKIETRPIKGTRPRGKNEFEDNKLVEELKNSEKDKAELLMIVDLERNDLGRISKIGTVEVPELFAIEKYANVSHLVATVCGCLDDEFSIYDAIKATFPGGSITGAPKIRSMEIIEELEPTRRNVYTGAIGYINFDSSADFNIAIRTIIKKDEDISFQVGGGITWDSDPEAEYQETIDKAGSIIKALNAKIETE